MWFDRILLDVGTVELKNMALNGRLGLCMLYCSPYPPIIVFPLQTILLDSCLEFIEDDCIFWGGSHFHHDIYQEHH